MIIVNDRDKFKIDKELLIEASNTLKKKSHSTQEEKELLYLSLFINDMEIPSTIPSSNENFRITYKNDFNILYDQYFDYINAIFDFYLLYGDEEINVENYESIVTSYESVFQSVHDFYYSLDKDWFAIFNKLYKDRHSTVELSSNRSLSILFPCSKLWIANIEAKGTIEDYVNTVHEYAHGIDDAIANRVRSYSPQNIFIELFPTVCQMIYLENNSDIRNQIEINKYLNNFQAQQIASSEEIKVRFNLVSAFPNVTNARNLSRLIKKYWEKTIPKEYLSLMYSNSLVESICYAYPFIIALELVSLYKQDIDLFKYKMNYILTSKEYPLDVIKKLNIIPNSINKVN